MSASRQSLAAAMVMAVGLSCAAAADTLTIAFDPQGDTTSVTTTTPYQQVTAYLLLLDPTGEEAINGWECLVDVQTTGPAPPITWTLAGNGLNIMTPPEFIVGVPVPTAEHGRRPARDGHDLRAGARPGDRVSPPAVLVPLADPAAGLSGAAAGLGAAAGAGLLRRAAGLGLHGAAGGVDQRRRRGPHARGHPRGQRRLRHRRGRQPGHPHAAVAQRRVDDGLRPPDPDGRGLPVPARRRPLDGGTDLGSSRSRRHPRGRGSLLAVRVRPLSRRPAAGLRRTAGVHGARPDAGFRSPATSAPRRSTSVWWNSAPPRSGS